MRNRDNPRTLVSEACQHTRCALSPRTQYVGPPASKENARLRQRHVEQTQLPLPAVQSLLCLLKVGWVQGLRIRRVVQENRESLGWPHPPATSSTLKPEPARSEPLELRAILEPPASADEEQRSVVLSVPA